MALFCFSVEVALEGKERKTCFRLILARKYVCAHETFRDLPRSFTNLTTTCNIFPAIDFTILQFVEDVLSFMIYIQMATWLRNIPNLDHCFEPSYFVPVVSIEADGPARFVCSFVAPPRVLHHSQLASSQNPKN